MRILSCLCFAFALTCQARPIETRSLEDIFDEPLQVSARSLAISISALNQNAPSPRSVAALIEIEKAIYRVRLDAARYRRHFGERSWHGISGLVGQLYSSTERAVSGNRIVNDVVATRILSDISRYRADLEISALDVLAQK